MGNLKIEFKIERLPFYAVSFKNGRKTFEAQAFDGIIALSLQYDYNKRPLELTCEVSDGDKIEAIIYEYRIELYVNGELVDEEWPFGKRLFELGDTVYGDNVVQVQEHIETKKELPCVISTFENAQDWYPGSGVFVGDCMPYTRGEEYHVLYLKDRHHHRSKWGMGAHQWEHISTKDFKTWSVHPMAVPITESWEGSICTGSWIEKDGVEYLYYTIRRANGLPAIITRSVSFDGYHFKKDRDFGFTVSKTYHTQSARDPKVFLGEDGLFHMILTTSIVEKEKGCLAHYVSCNMESWTEKPPIYVHTDTAQPECPDYFKYNGKYYLVFSIRGRARYLVSNQPFDNFEMIDDTLIPCAGVPKCAQWNGKLVFTGFKVIDGYAGKMTFNSATSDDDGRLIFEC